MFQVVNAVDNIPVPDPDTGTPLLFDTGAAANAHAKNMRETTGQPHRVLRLKSDGAWRMREFIRLHDGTYKVPEWFWERVIYYIESNCLSGVLNYFADIHKKYNASIRDADDTYFRHVRTRQAEKIRHAAYSQAYLVVHTAMHGIVASRCYDHFVHVSETGTLAYTESDAKGAVDVQGRLKPGKYLTKYFSDILLAQQIQDIALRWACEFETFNLRITQDADQIEHVYLNGPSSCMSAPVRQYNSEIHPVRAYGKGDLALAYLTNDDGDIFSARAVVWPDRKVYGRIYGDEHRMREALTRAGYRRGQFFDARIARIPQGDWFVCPFVDRHDYLSDDGEFLRFTHDYGSTSMSCQTTTGLTR